MSAVISSPPHIPPIGKPFQNPFGDHLSFVPSDLSPIAWFEAINASNFTLGSIVANRADLEFDTTNPPSGWQTIGTATSGTGALICTTTSGSEDLLRDSQGGGRPETWVECGITFSTGSVFSTTAGGNGFMRLSLSGSSRSRVGIFDDSGTNKFTLVDIDNAGSNTTIFASPLPVLGEENVVEFRRVSGAAADGIVQLWIDGVLVHNITNETNDTVGTVNRLEIGNEATGGASNYTSTMSFFKWGDSGLPPTNISAWGDLSGNSNHLTQSTVANQPIYDADNTRVTFDGVSDVLAVNTFSGGALTQPTTIYTVHTYDSNDDQHMLFSSDQTAARQEFSIATTNYRISAGSNVDAGTPDTTEHIGVYVFNTTSSLFYIDGGAAIGSGDAGTDDYNGITLAARFDELAATIADCQIRFFMVIDGLSTDAEINKMGTYLNGKFTSTPTWTDI